MVAMDPKTLRQIEDDEMFAHLELDIEQIKTLRVAVDEDVPIMMWSRAYIIHSSLFLLVSSVETIASWCVYISASKASTGFSLLFIDTNYLNIREIFILRTHITSDIPVHIYIYLSHSSLWIEPMHEYFNCIWLCRNKCRTNTKWASKFNAVQPGWYQNFSPPFRL